MWNILSLGIHPWQCGEMVANFPMLFSWWPNNYQGIRFWLGSRSNLKLRYMLACTDEEFNKKVEAIVKVVKDQAGLLEGDLWFTVNWWPCGDYEAFWKWVNIVIQFVFRAFCWHSLTEFRGKNSLAFLLIITNISFCIHNILQYGHL